MLPRPSREKTWISARPPRAHGYSLWLTTNPDKLSEVDNALWCNRVAVRSFEFIPFSFWYDAPLTSQDSDRRHNAWLVYGLPHCSPAR
jgi:hypothetical protein